MSVLGERQTVKNTDSTEVKTDRIAVSGCLLNCAGRHSHTAAGA